MRRPYDGKGIIVNIQSLDEEEERNMNEELKTLPLEDEIEQEHFSNPEDDAGYAEEHYAQSKEVELQNAGVEEEETQ